MATFKRPDAGRYALSSTRDDGYLANLQRGTRYTLATAIVQTVRRQKLASSYRPNSDRNGEVVYVNR